MYLGAKAIRCSRQKTAWRASKVEVGQAGHAAARRDDAGDGRLGGLRDPRGERCADHHADGQGGTTRPRFRSGDGRGRLHRQAARNAGGHRACVRCSAAWRRMMRPKAVVRQSGDRQAGVRSGHQGQARVDAPPKEIELLYFLAASQNRVFTRAAARRCLGLTN